MNLTDLPLTEQRATSAIIWRGQSPVDGANIVAVISGLRKGSQNDKTGPMAQVDILLADMHPWEGIKTGADKAICGSCPLRLQDGKRICYVNVVFGQGNKYKAMPQYIDISPSHIAVILQERGIRVRFGAYGDPAMMPFEVVDAILGQVKHTSYTHQWAESWFDPRHLIYSMASVDHVITVARLRAIHGDDARYYRLVDSYKDLSAGEVKCPSDTNKRNADGKRKVTCNTCTLCAGTSRQAKSVVIVENA